MVEYAKCPKCGNKTFKIGVVYSEIEGSLYFLKCPKCKFETHFERGMYGLIGEVEL
jgi:predicted nucleic-acid-binding Zn-ribbon protein